MRWSGRPCARACAAEGFTIDWVRDGREAEVAQAATEYDAVLLDLGLPRREGLAVLSSLRAGGRDVPVLIVTARDAVADRVRGLNAGADDYLVRALQHLDELVARVHALLRRAAGWCTARTEARGSPPEPRHPRVTWPAGRPVVLSAREFALLHALMQRPGAVLSVARLQDEGLGLRRGGRRATRSSVHIARIAPQAGCRADPQRPGRRARDGRPGLRVPEER
jgi:two-component system response regulator QseB